MNSIGETAEEKRPPDPTPKAKLPSVDGWRALSICMVLAEHSEGLAGFPEHNRLRAWTPVFFDGILGVRFFL
jgi:hypothetical protein